MPSVTFGGFSIPTRMVESSFRRDRGFTLLHPFPPLPFLVLIMLIISFQVSGRLDFSQLEMKKVLTSADLTAINKSKVSPSKAFEHAEATRRGNTELL